MALSQLCTEQHRKEEAAARRWFCWGLLGAVGLHAALIPWLRPVPLKNANELERIELMVTAPNGNTALMESAPPPEQPLAQLEQPKKSENQNREAPEASEEPEAPKEPETPKGPEESKAPEEPEESENLEESEEPKDSKESEEQKKPEAPEEPEAPECATSRLMRCSIVLFRTVLRRRTV